MTWHNTSHYIASSDVTITWPDSATDIKTSKHFTSQHKTSPPWNGRRLVHSKEMIWASRWSVALRTFYRQILSALYSSYPFGNFRPRLVRALLVGQINILGKYMHCQISNVYQCVYYVCSHVSSTLWKDGEKIPVVTAWPRKTGVLWCVVMSARCERHGGRILETRPFKHELKWYTLHGTNISHQKSLLKMIFLFPRWDMLIPWRVNYKPCWIN